ncbi:MAG: DUF5719 family protein [Propionibacteriaceae bacterium]
MSIRENAGWVITVGTTVVVLAFSGMLFPGQKAESRAVTVQVSQSMVCPIIDDAKAASTIVAWNANGKVSTTSLSASGSRSAVSPMTANIFTATKTPVLIEIDAKSSGGGGVGVLSEAGVERGLQASSCERPASAAWIAGVTSDQTHATNLILTNTDASTALVDLNFYGVAGRLIAAGSRSVEVKSGDSTKVALGPLVNSSDPITVGITTSQGRVAVQGHMVEYVSGEDQGRGADLIPQSLIAKDLVIPAVPTSAGKRQLVLTNPGNRSTDVSIEFLTSKGVKVIEQAAGLTIGAEATATIDIGAFLADELVSLRLHSEQPIVASVLSRSGEKGDFAVSPATRSFNGAVEIPLVLKGTTAKLHFGNPAHEPARGGVIYRSKDGKELGRAIFDVPAESSSWIDVPVADVVIASLSVESGEVSAGFVLNAPIGDMAGLAVVAVRGDTETEVAVDPVHNPRQGIS